jgi:DNA polymerase-3 subunit epsilon
VRQVVLDTETTGLEPSQGHRLIEIGCVELINRRLTGRHFHVYLNPDREVEAGAIEVHGITNEFLADKPRFPAVVDDFLDFIRDAEVIIHNAAFDVGFIEHELNLLGRGHPPVATICRVTDTLAMARQRHPGQKNNLDALCNRYGVDNSQRELHGALLDAEILADVYLLMTGGQTALALAGDELSVESSGSVTTLIRRLPSSRPPLRVVRAEAGELAAHEQRLLEIDKSSGGQTLFRRGAEAAAIAE